MAIQTVDTLKSWFHTGDKPTPQQFADLIESFVHKQDGMTIANVAGLAAALGLKLDAAQFNTYVQGQSIVYNADGSFELPAGVLLESILVVPDAALIGFKMGTTPGGYETVPEIPIAVDGEIIQLNIYAKVAKTFYLSGITTSTEIIYIKRTIKP